MREDSRFERQGKWERDTDLPQGDMLSVSGTNLLFFLCDKDAHQSVSGLSAATAYCSFT